MTVKEQLIKYNIVPNKALGQNFLADEMAIKTIVSKARADGKNALEIGAGLGALTHSLNSCTNKLVVVEIDSAMVTALQSQEWEKPDSLEIIHSDFLKVPDSRLEEILGQNFCVIANLPYYVTTPIAMKLMQSGLSISAMTLMMQKEAAPRFTAAPGTKLYSPLAVLTEYLYNVEEILSLSPQSYYPAPDVHSVVLRFESKNEDLSLVKSLSRVLKAAFATRRKTIQNNIMSLGLTKQQAADVLAMCDIPCSKRAEQLLLSDYLKLCRAVTLQKN